MLKNIIYGIMDLFTIAFFGWLIFYVIMNFAHIAWGLPTVLMMIAVVWTAVRFVKIYWHAYRTIRNIKKGINR